MKNDIAIRVSNVIKEYRLGSIGGGTLKADIQSWWAKVRGKEDPNSKIGTDTSKYGQRFRALDDISFEIKKGEAVGVIGGNGAGKSTILKLISRVTAPTKGSISYNGKLASLLEVGTGFHPEFTGRQNIYLNGTILGMSKKEIDKKLDEIIAFSEVEQFIDTPVKRYSSGMHIKLGFSVAAHLNPDIMIVDEVLAVGDMKYQKKCVEKMASIAAAGNTVLFVSHNMGLVQQLCSRGIVLEKGKKVYDGNVDDAVSRYVAASNDIPAVINFADCARASTIISQEAKMLEFTFINKKKGLFDYGEKLHFAIKWQANVNVKDMYLRAIIKHNGLTSIGTAVTSEPMEAKEGEIVETEFCIDKMNLANGYYGIDLILYSINDFGQSNRIDYVNNMVKFEVVAKGNVMGVTNEWSHAAYGFCKFDDIKLVK